MRIPDDDWRLAVIAPDGTVIDTVDIGDADLTKPLSAMEVGWQVEQTVKRHLGITDEEAGA